MMSRVVLVTGSTSGIGEAAALRFAANGDHVVFNSVRSVKEGERLASSTPNAHYVQGDIARPEESVRIIRDVIEACGRLDVLVNNAGITNAGEPGRPMAEVVKSGRASVATLDEVRAVFETNVFGVIAVTQAMLPLLREAPAARIVNISSGGGSLTRNSDPTNPHRSMFGTYSSSKAALNAVTLAFASDLESTGIKVNAADPGFTATDLNGFAGTRSVQEAAREPVRLALLDANGPTGTFSNEDGPVPW